MDLTVTIDSNDRTKYVDWKTFKKTDVLTSQVDTLIFETKKYGSKNWQPTAGMDIEVTDSGTKIFAGVIVKVTEIPFGEQTMTYKVICKDYTHAMDQQLIIETYTAQTINQIIAHIQSNYLPGGYTVNNVSCAKVIDLITFNYIAPTKAIQQLAELVGFDWYVDYDKDIHFFEKEVNDAPFDLTDTNGNYVSKTLVIKSDQSQLRNIVTIRGGEYVGSSVTEKYDADGEQSQFPLAYKYSAAPTVKVNTVSKTVGIDGIESFDDYDCLWNFNEKYVKFNAALSVGDDLEVAGTPLYPVLVKVRNQASIDANGGYEYKIVDKSIDSKQVARERGYAELLAYAQGITEGVFQTYRGGLRSGQLINVHSTIRSIDEDYLINKVVLKMFAPNDGVYMVNLVSTRTFGIIEFLQKLLMEEDKKIKVSQDEILEKIENIDEGVSIAEEITRETENEVDDTISLAENIRRDPWTPVWVLAHYTPVNDADPKRHFYLDISSFLY